MDGLDIYSYDGENYDPTMHFGAWRVAFLNHGDRFTRGKITYLERHMLTDEVFVLLRGAATLLGGAGDGRAEQNLQCARRCLAQRHHRAGHPHAGGRESQYLPR